MIHQHIFFFMHSIKDKLQKNKATVTKADKGSSLIIIYRHGYEQKIHNFISNSGAKEVNNNITTRFQKDLRSTINDCTLLIDTEKKGRFINLNPGTPPLRGLVKIHKEGTPIRPVVNLHKRSIVQTSKTAHRHSKNTHPIAQRI